MDLENKKILVTGASGGIGSAIVSAFRTEGALVTGTDLVAGNPEADFWIDGDLANRAFCEDLVGEAADRIDDAVDRTLQHEICTDLLPHGFTCFFGSMQVLIFQLYLPYASGTDLLSV